MATQKVRQDPGALDRQVANRGRRSESPLERLRDGVGVGRGGRRGLRAHARRDEGRAGERHRDSIGAGAGPGTMIDLRTGDVTRFRRASQRPGVYHAVSPDHTTVAYSACCDSPEPLFVANVDGTGSARSPRSEGCLGAQWSPDGSMLVYQQRDGSTQRLGTWSSRTCDRSTKRVTNFDQTQPWDWWFRSRASRRTVGRSSSSYPEATPTTRPGTSGPAGRRREADPRPTQRRVGRLLAGRRWLAYLSPVSKNDFTGGGLWIASVHGGTPQALVRGRDPVAAVVAGWDADLLLRTADRSTWWTPRPVRPRGSPTVAPPSGSTTTR